MAQDRPVLPAAAHAMLVAEQSWLAVLAVSSARFMGGVGCCGTSQVGGARSSYCTRASAPIHDIFGQECNANQPESTATVCSTSLGALASSTAIMVSKTCRPWWHQRHVHRAKTCCLTRFSQYKSGLISESTSISVLSV